MFIRYMRVALMLPYMLLLVVPSVLLRPLFILFGLRELNNRLLNWYTVQGAHMFLWALGARLHVEGLEHLKGLGKRICFMGNHQGVADIAALKCVVSGMFGFIIKKEARYIPIIGTCARAMGSVFLDRKSPRQSVQAIAKGVEVIKSGIPLVIFPEGTRSKRFDKIGEMRRGAFQLAKRSEAQVVPFVLQNMSAILEEKRPFAKEDIYVSFYPPILATEPNAADRVFSLIKDEWQKGFHKLND